MLRARLTELTDLMVDGKITAGQLARGTDRASGRLAVVEAAMADAAQISVLGQLVGAVDVAKRWAAMDLDAQRAVISTLFTVTLHSPGKGVRTFNPDTVEITWRT